MTRPRAVLYERLSAVQDDSTSIARQNRDLHALAEREGWEIVRELVDEGISGRKHRANVDEALRMIAEGEADVIAVWKLDRWSRQGLNAMGRLVDVLDSKPGSLFVAYADGLRSDSASFRLVAAVLSEVARAEAEAGVVRAKSAMHYRKTEANKFAGGASVPFGYRSVPAPDGVGRVLVVNEREAAVVRDLAERLLEGVESLAGITRSLNEEGVPTSKSAYRRALNRGEAPEGLERGLWRSSTVRELVTADTVLGRVVHRGDLVRDDHGLPRQVWSPLLDLVTVERLREKLGRTTRRRVPYPEPAKRGPRPGRGRASRLLSGLAYCALCDARLYVTTSGGKAIYACPTSRNTGDCASPKINADGLDAHVSEAFLAVAGGWPEVEVVDGVDSAARDAALAEVESALREATAAMLDEGADVAALAQRVTALRARRDEARAMPIGRSSQAVPTGRTIREAWEAEESNERRRALLLWGMDHVTVTSATARGISPIDPRRVRIVWREEDVEDYDAPFDSFSNDFVSSHHVPYVGRNNVKA